jgi:hypothetical protein
MEISGGRQGGVAPPGPRELNVATITMAAMAALGVRSASLPLARPTRSSLQTEGFRRTRANRDELLPAFAMQKVVGSSPIIRSKEKPRGEAVAQSLGAGLFYF